MLRKVVGRAPAQATRDGEAKDVAMIGNWPIETFGRPLWTRLTLQRRLSRLTMSIRSDTSATVSPDRPFPTPSLVDRERRHQFQYRNLSDDPYQSLELDDILESPRRG
jgi:hypothetical protein